MAHLTRSLRWLLLLLAAGASFFLGSQWLQSSQGAQDNTALALPLSKAERTNPAATTATAATTTAQRDPTLEPPERLHSVPSSSGDAFAPVSWLPPPKPQPVVVAPPPPPPPAPTAPPLPFTFVGLLEQGFGVTQPKAFLARGDALLVVAAGDTVENNYSIDSITAQQITLTYLPLKTRQTLNVSGAPR